MKAVEWVLTQPQDYKDRLLKELVTLALINGYAVFREDDDQNYHLYSTKFGDRYGERE